jgi:hypothetical protein
MKYLWAIFCGLIALAVWLVRDTISDLVKEEAKTRITQIPSFIIKLAAKRVPIEIRADLADEWKAESEFIVNETEGLPITRLVRGTWYALGVLQVSRSVSSELTGIPAWLLTLRSLRKPIKFMNLALASLTIAMVSASLAMAGFFSINSQPGSYVGNMSGWNKDMLGAIFFDISFFTLTLCSGIVYAFWSNKDPSDQSIFIPKMLGAMIPILIGVNLFFSSLADPSSICIALLFLYFGAQIIQKPLRLPPMALRISCTGLLFSIGIFWILNSPSPVTYYSSSALFTLGILRWLPLFVRIRETGSVFLH